MAGTTGLEPATSAVTGRRSNQLSYVPSSFLRLWISLRTCFNARLQTIATRNICPYPVNQIVPNKSGASPKSHPREKCARSRNPGGNLYLIRQQIVILARHSSLDDAKIISKVGILIPENLRCNDAITVTGQQRKEVLYLLPLWKPRWMSCDDQSWVVLS